MSFLIAFRTNNLLRKLRFTIKLDDTMRHNKHQRKKGTFSCSAGFVIPTTQNLTAANYQHSVLIKPLNMARVAKMLGDVVLEPF